jgi:hypothetical protein
LLVDTASAIRRLGPDALARWAATRTAFLSCEMRELGELRGVIADALRGVGFSIVVFEDLGGRDEDAERPTSTAWRGVSAWTAARYRAWWRTARRATPGSTRSSRRS